MEGNAKTVHLIAYAANQFQALTVKRQFYTFFISGEKDLFFVLSQAYHGHTAYEVQLADAFHGGAQLSFTPIDDHQLRQRLLLCQQAFVAAEHHFCHGCKVVDALYRLNIEMPVIFFGSNTLFEHYAGAYGVAALEVGVIETLYMGGEYG